MLVRNYTFTDQDVVLDFGEFHDCRFERCNLILHGHAPPTMVGNHVIDCRWSLAGPAANTVSFMAALYQQGGLAKDLIEQTFQDIRRGKESNPHS